MHDVAEMMRPRAETKGLELTLDLDEGLPRYIHTDARKLRQILINLLSNAVKYSDRGSITLSAQASAKGGAAERRLQLAVEDTGRGIAAKDLAHIYEPFFQVSHGGTTEGTGLGLPITREFVHLMGGEIYIDSEPGQGSRFTVELPFTVSDTGSVSEQARLRIAGLSAASRPCRILVVDDAEPNRMLLTQLLTDAGFEVREAVNGRQALAVFKAWRPQLVWMDMRMPVMDGYAATRAIKAAPGGDKTVIIALTTSVSVKELDQVREAGCAELLRKPYDEDEIFALMHRLLGVEYLYEDWPAGRSPADIPKHLTHSLPRLLPALYEDLRQAVQTGDIAAIEHAVEAVARHDAALGASLRDYTDDFRYDDLLNLLDKGGAGDEDA